MIALLVDGPANGQVYRDLPRDTWIIRTHGMREVAFVNGEPDKDFSSLTFPARYIRTAKGDGESATFQFEVPGMYR